MLSDCMTLGTRHQGIVRASSDGTTLDSPPSMAAPTVASGVGLPWEIQALFAVLQGTSSR